MKKTYEKPQIVFDSFELSQAIAAGCEFLSNATEAVCPVDVRLGDDMFLFQEHSGCGTTPPGKPGESGEGGGYYDLVCYDVPNDFTRVFSS